MTEINLTTGCCALVPSNIGKIIELNTPKKQLIIDFLFLDLSVCTRCQGTDSGLDEAVAEVANILTATGNEVVVNKINVNTAELAEKYKFLSSPTIRINGQDIQMEVKESLCESCGDLCGDTVDCRVWVYQGREYNVPPKGMIIEAILKAVYGGQAPVEARAAQYVLPENLRNFYAAMAKQDKGVEE
ncbi:MAG: DUF2703 domain-containing protein [Syntrophomonadaceae bacterium]|nr:DUF2703 domain-containing protein [Syntrophomonadaceae bacterium]